MIKTCKRHVSMCCPDGNACQISQRNNKSSRTTTSEHIFKYFHVHKYIVQYLILNATAEQNEKLSVISSEVVWLEYK